MRYSMRTGTGPRGWLTRPRRHSVNSLLLVVVFVLVVRGTGGEIVEFLLGFAFAVLLVRVVDIEHATAAPFADGAARAATLGLGLGFCRTAAATAGATLGASAAHVIEIGRPGRPRGTRRAAHRGTTGTAIAHRRTRTTGTTTRTAAGRTRGERAAILAGPRLADRQRPALQRLAVEPANDFFRHAAI